MNKILYNRSTMNKILRVYNIIRGGGYIIFHLSVAVEWMGHRTPSPVASSSLRRLATETSTPPPVPYVPGSNDSYDSPRSTTRKMAVLTKQNPPCLGSMHAVGRFSDLGVSIPTIVGM